METKTKNEIIEIDTEAEKVVVGINTKNEIAIAELFQPEILDKILSEIEKEAKTFVFDITTEEGKSNIKSFAHKIARTKTTLDNLGKDLTEDWARKKKTVDTERKKARDRLDELKEQVRKPLTDWENRIEACKLRISEIENYKNYSYNSETSASFDVLIEKIKKLLEYEWEDLLLQSRADRVADEVIQYLNEEKAKVKKAEEEKIELEKLRKEKEEREQKEREEKIARESAEKARLEAEEKARQERIKLEREVEEKQKAIEQARRETERKVKEREEKMKTEKLEAENRAKKAEEEAKKAREQAIIDERARVDKEREREMTEFAKREANKKYKAKIHNEIMTDLMNVKSELYPNVDPGFFKEIVTAIAKKEIRHLSINY